MTIDKEKESMIAARDRMKEKWETKRREHRARIAWIDAVRAAWKPVADKYPTLGAFMASPEGQEFQRKRPEQPLAN
jgi:hypothetical protein